MRAGEEFYEICACGESVQREYCFDRMAEIFGTNYEYLARPQAADELQAPGAETDTRQLHPSDKGIKIETTRRRATPHPPPLKGKTKNMKSKYEIKVTGETGNWMFGTIGKPGGELLVFQAKHYDEPSQFGIENAPVAEGDQVGRTSAASKPRSGRKSPRWRISKLCVRRNGVARDVITYERGWLVRPRTEAHRAVLAALKKKFN